MAKTGVPASGPAGLAEWLPLLGAICQVLASLGDEDEAKPAPSGKLPYSGAETGERLRAGGKSDR
ncbi:MAG: hypothetical protein R3285_00185 [Kiloniellales bacterium]|nr:hypothetical protein [Kiloniellales bacterium]